MKKLLFFLFMLAFMGLSHFANAQNFEWAKQLGGVSSDVGSSIAVDAFGNVYTTGYFQGTADFDPGPGAFNLTSAGGGDIFISKLDASGNFVWAKQMGGTSEDVGYSIAVDASGNVFTTGYFEGTADFDPGPGTFNLTSAGNTDIFISKLDASGNFVWAKQLGGTDYDSGVSIALDTSGNVYTTGWFQGTVDFDPGPGTFNLTSAGNSDIFVHKMSQSNTGLGEIFFEQIMSIYPNPNDGQFIIELYEESNITVINSLGATVYRAFYSSGSYSLDLSYLAGGVYLIKSESKDNVNVLRVVISPK